MTSILKQKEYFRKIIMIIVKNLAQLVRFLEVKLVHLGSSPWVSTGAHSFVHLLQDLTDDIRSIFVHESEVPIMVIASILMIRWLGVW
jgi:hypothetical protein